MSEIDINLPPAHRAYAPEGGDWHCRRKGTYFLDVSR